MRLLRVATALAVAATFVVAGCSDDSRNAAPPDPSAEAFRRSQVLIDSGNVAYRAGDYENAARRYASAAVAQPEDAAAYYGLGMSLAKLGRGDEARVAYAKARALASAAAADTTVHR